MLGMRRILLSAIVASLLPASCAQRPPARQDPVAGPSGSASPVAVVELFTSEGCSSCPPADRHLADLEREARSRERNVFTLSFHVDYWNHLGWQDPFSDARYSERQQLYAKALSGGQVYTPQLVVNGREEFVGTARAKVAAAVERNLAQPASLAIALVPELAQSTLEVGYRLEGDTRNAVLHVAVTQPVPHVAVSRGENAGRTLSHQGVVRAFVSQELNGKPTGSLGLELPGGMDPRQATLVAYAADVKTLAVLGAALAPLGSPQR